MDKVKGVGREGPWLSTVLNLTVFCQRYHRYCMTDELIYTLLNLQLDIWGYPTRLNRRNVSPYNLFGVRMLIRKVASRVSYDCLMFCWC